MIALVKVPVPVPSVVCAPDATGFILVLQQTPLAVTLAPPSAVTLPPLLAEMVVIKLMAVVVTVARTGAVGKLVKLNSLP